MKGMTVQRLLTFYEEPIEQFMKQLGKYLMAGVAQDESLVRSAQSFVRNGAVQLVDYKPVQHEADFVVRDVQDAYVHISFYEESSCSCSGRKMCRHQAAVLFYFYQHMNSLSEWVKTWRSHADHQSIAAIQKDRTPLAWEQYASTLLNQLVMQEHASSFFLMEFALGDYKRQMQRIRPLEREWHVLFDTSVTLMTLVKLWPTFNSLSRENERGRVRYYLDETIQELKHQFKQLQQQPRFFAADPFYERIERYVRHLLTDAEGYFSQRSALYSHYWSELGTSKHAREKELAFLEAHSETKDGNSLLQVRQLFYFQLGQTDRLLKSMTKIPTDEVANYLSLIQFSLEEHQIEMATQMFERLLPAIEEYLDTDTRASRLVYTLRYIERQLDLSEESQAKFYRMLIPFTLEPFSNWLIDQERYNDWADLHLYCQSGITYAETCGLEIVKDEAPFVLLPLYHMNVMREINEKKRDSYKQAVRYMKKMKQLAKAANETVYWNHYVQEIREKFRRLRAFQQEMEKGNLSL
ncbi:hypothetical protein AB5N96_09080 [Chryseomicrobium imtechense]